MDTHPDGRRGRDDRAAVFAIVEWVVVADAVDDDADVARPLSVAGQEGRDPSSGSDHRRHPKPRRPHGIHDP